MIRNKYVVTIIIAVVISAVGILIQENSGERYFTCLGRQKKEKKFDGKNILLSSYITLSMEADGKGKLQYDGFIYEDRKSKKIERVIDFSFASLKNRKHFMFKINKITKHPTDTVEDTLFNEFSDMSDGSKILSLKRMGEKALILGDTLQPRFVCIAHS